MFKSEFFFAEVHRVMLRINEKFKVFSIWALQGLALLFGLFPALGVVFFSVKRLSKQPDDDPAGVRWIISDLIGFTYRMKKIEAEVDTT